MCAWRAHPVGCVCGVAIRQVSQKSQWLCWNGPYFVTYLSSIRALLGLKGSAICQEALTFIGAFPFFSKRPPSLRATVFPGGFVPTHELLAQASQWRVPQKERKKAPGGEQVW